MSQYTVIHGTVHYTVKNEEKKDERKDAVIGDRIELSETDARPLLDSGVIVEGSHDPSEFAETGDNERVAAAEGAKKEVPPKTGAVPVKTDTIPARPGGRAEPINPPPMSSEHKK